MIQTIQILPGVTLRCCQDSRFKQSCLSLQLVRPMCRDEAAKNALLPAVLLRGTAGCPDLRSITLRLDDLYGASVGTLVRRIGDYHVTGLFCNFIEDRFSLDGEPVLEPMVSFLRELLLEPVLENGVFREDFVESEKKNLIATIEAQFNDKRSYAATRMLRNMCSADSFGIPRLGHPEDVAAITPEGLYRHYQMLLTECPVCLFYVGSREPEQVAGLLKPIFASIDRNWTALPAQTPFRDGGGSDTSEVQSVSQGKLSMGFTTDIRIGDDRFAAMQVCNTVLGAGMTSKLFTQIREKMSLCYDIHSGYHGTKGIVTVSAGIDFDKDFLVRQQVLAQLEACCQGQITPQELHAAKEAVCSSLQGIHDRPGSIENYYATGALSGLSMTPEQYRQAVQAVTVQQVAQAARTLKLHTVFFLKGVA